MAFDAYLQIEGIPGESTDALHSQWIEVLSFNHSIIQPISGSVSSGGGRTAGRSEHSNFSVTKTLDKATPLLHKHSCSGKHIPKVVMEVCRSDDPKVTYYVVTMKNVIVSSVENSGAPASGEPLPVETVSFAYGHIEWKYTELDHDTNEPKGDITNSYDLKTNEAK